MSTLPSLCQLVNLPTDIWHCLGTQLRAAGLDANYLEGAWQGGMRSHQAILRRPLVLWQLRKSGNALSFAQRLFMLRDSITLNEAESLLGLELMRTFLDAGLLTSAGSDHVVSCFDLRVYRGLLVFCDNLYLGEDAVFGVGPGTAAFYPPGDREGALGRVLDLGCGAGGVALWFSRHASHVVATDINPRALMFARINAAINGITNFEVRQGDLFAPVYGEQFDFIISQPPYLPYPPNSPSATWQYGGDEGHELLSRLMCNLPQHLSSNGRAILVFDQFMTESEEIRWGYHLPTASKVNTLLILGKLVKADEYSIRYAAPALRSSMFEFEQRAISMREHLSKIGVSGACPAICIVEPTHGAVRWNDSVSMGTTLWDEISGPVLDQLMASAKHAHQFPDIRRPRSVRIPDGSLVIRRIQNGYEVADPLYLALQTPCQTITLELWQHEWETLQAVHRGEDLPIPQELLDKIDQMELEKWS